MARLQGINFRTNPQKFRTFDFGHRNSRTLSDLERPKLNQITTNVSSCCTKYKDLIVPQASSENMCRSRGMVAKSNGMFPARSSRNCQIGHVFTQTPVVCAGTLLAYVFRLRIHHGFDLTENGQLARYKLSFESP